jgi:glucan phosphoethanolaminetransferase (alkaline phosphatase superfamily)
MKKRRVDITLLGFMIPHFVSVARTLICISKQYRPVQWEKTLIEQAAYIIILCIFATIVCILTKTTQPISKFKKAIQPVQIPVASFYNIGDRKTNIIHTKLRHRCSGLNADLYRVNLKNDPRCVCGHLFEDAIHFFLECPLFTVGDNNY